ncbi:MAG: hypothetical protein Q9P01_10145 [Anaerolineae bacterium]|nr:hypothetical protein [Anaerolineae bacterium]
MILGPTFVFAFVIATMMGALFHLIVGGNARRLALFLLAGWIGFALGHIGGGTLGISFLPIGQLRIVRQFLERFYLDCSLHIHIGVQAIIALKSLFQGFIAPHTKSQCEITFIDLSKLLC